MTNLNGKPSIDDIIAAARKPEKTITICLRGDLQAEWEELERQLRAEETGEETLAKNPKARTLDDRMKAIETEMAEHQVTFRFRGLGAKAYSDLIARCKSEDDKQEESSDDGTDWSIFPSELIAACAIEPRMSLQQVERLSDAVSARQWDDLFTVALAVNKAEVSVPFSLSASAIRASTGQSSKPPARGASPVASSSDESLGG